MDNLLAGIPVSSSKKEPRYLGYPASVISISTPFQGLPASPESVAGLDRNTQVISANGTEFIKNGDLDLFTCPPISGPYGFEISLALINTPKKPPFRSTMK
jgi:hypothetical protein